MISILIQHKKSSYPRSKITKFKRLRKNNFSKAVILKMVNKSPIMPNLRTKTTSSFFNAQLFLRTANVKIFKKLKL